MGGVKKLIGKKDSGKGGVPDKVKIKPCRECPRFRFFRNIDFDKDYHRTPETLGREPLGRVLFVMSPRDFDGLDRKQWKHVICSELADFDVSFVPFPRCYENAFAVEKIGVHIWRGCREHAIGRILEAMNPELVVVFDDTKNVLSLDGGPEIPHPGNWADWRGRKAYLAKGLWHPRGFDLEGFKHTASRIRKFFAGKLFWQSRPNFKKILTSEDLAAVRIEVLQLSALALDFETTGLDVLEDGFRLKTIGLAWPGKAICIGFEIPECPDIKYRAQVLSFLEELLKNPKIKKVAWNLKYEIKVALVKGLSEFNAGEDGMFMAYLLDENRRSNSLKFLGGEYLDGYPKQLNDFANATYEDLWFYNCLDAVYTFRLWAVDLELEQLGDLALGAVFVYENVLLPLCRELALMEVRGVKIDYDYTIRLQTVISEEIQELLEIIRRDYPQMGQDFKKLEEILNSPKKLADVLFSMLRFPVIKPTKTGASTDKETLITLKEKHGCKLAEYILAVRGKEKLLSTYITPYIEKRGIYRLDRVRCSYGQVKNYGALKGEAKGTVTGRLCVSGDTLLETSIGKIRIDDARVCSGIFILSHEGRFRRILARYYKGKELMYRVTLGDGRSIKCTAGHRFLTPDRWKHLYELHENSSICSYIDPGSDKKQDEGDASAVGIRGRGLCASVFNSSADAGAYISKLSILWNFLAYNSRLTPVVGEEVRKGALRYKNSTLFGGFEGEYSGEAFADEDFGERGIGTIGNMRISYYKNSQSFGSERVFGKSKYATFWSRWTQTFTACIAGFRLGLFGKVGDFLSVCYSFCKKSGSRARKVLSRPLRWLLGCAADGCYGSKNAPGTGIFFGSSWDKDEICLCESESIRGSICGGFIKKGDKTRAKLAASGKLFFWWWWKFYFRFLFKRLQCCGGTGWELSQKRSGDNEERRRERAVASEGQCSSVSNRYGCCLEESRRGCVTFIEEVIKKIEPIGVLAVWDISVEEDHSYLAAGSVNHNSSAGPNLQNIPRDKKIKRMYIPSAPGRVLLQADLSQAELRIGASLANEEKMLSIFAVDGDIHEMTGLFCLPPSVVDKYNSLLDGSEKKIAFKNIRQSGKSLNFANLYIGSHLVLMRVAKQNYGVEFSEPEALVAYNAYHQMYPGIGVWHKNVEEYIRKYWCTVSPYGRIRRAPKLAVIEDGSSEYSATIRELLNSTVQGSCADFLGQAWTTAGVELRRRGLDKWLVDYALPLYPVLTVHDNVVFDALNKDVAEEAVAVLSQACARWSDYHREAGWLKCDMKMDFEIGEHWGALEEVDVAVGEDFEEGVAEAVE